MSTTSISRLSGRFLAAMVIGFVLLWPVSVLLAQDNSNQPPLQFCPIVGLPAAEPTTVTTDNESNTLTGEIAVVNPTDFYLPGSKVAIAVYEDKKQLVPEFWTVLPEDLMLTPQSRIAVPFSLDQAALPAGDHVIRAFVAQGESELLATALRGVLQTQSVAFTKSGGDSVQETEIAVVGATVSGNTFTVSTSAVPVSVAITAAAETPLHILLSRHQLPFGDSVYVNEMAVGSVSYEWALPDGPFHLYVTSPIAGVLTPLTEAVINIGRVEDRWITIYPFISIIGLSNHPIIDDTTATVCLGNYSPDNHLVSVPTEAVQIDFQVLNGEGNVVDSKQPQTPRLQNFAQFTLSAIVPNSTFKAVLSTERVYNPETDGPDFVPVQTIGFTHNCDTECQKIFTKSVTDFAQETHVQTSFWYFAGIVIAAALLMYLMLRRLDEPVESASYTSPDEIQ